MYLFEYEEKVVTTAICKKKMKGDGEENGKIDRFV